MVFFKPSMIKVGFLLVAGSQKWVLRMTHKAESLQAEEVIPSSLPGRRSDIWQPRWPGARPRRTQSHVQIVTTNLPRRRAVGWGRDEYLDRRICNSESLVVAAALTKRKGPWPSNGNELLSSKKSSFRPQIWLNQWSCFQQNMYSLSSSINFLNDRFSNT